MIMKPRKLVTPSGTILVVPADWYNRVYDEIMHSVSYVYATRRYTYYIDSLGSLWRCCGYPFDSSDTLRVVPDDVVLSDFFNKE